MVTASYSVRLRERGQVTLPQSVRRNLSVEEGDLLTLLQIDDIVLLAPKQVLIPRLSEEFSAIMEEEGVTLADLLKGLEEERELNTRGRKQANA